VREHSLSLSKACGGVAGRRRISLSRRVEPRTEAPEDLNRGDRGSQVLEAPGRRFLTGCRSILADGAPSEKPGNTEPKRPKAATLERGRLAARAQPPDAQPLCLSRKNLLGTAHRFYQIVVYSPHHEPRHPKAQPKGQGGLEAPGRRLAAPASLHPTGHTPFYTKLTRICF